MTRNELILKMALDAGKAIAAIKPTEATKINKEGQGNYVTLADKTSEQIIFTLIREHFPEDTVLSEETETSTTEQQLLNADHLWIIDPIDGTANYQHSRRYSSISIGYAEKGLLQLAVVYDPFREELYTAEAGKGALHNGNPMHVSSAHDLEGISLITDNSYDPAIIRKHLETVLKLDQTPWVIMKGSLALEYCEVANGQSDILFSFCPKPWDNAAGFLIMKEAGGTVINLKGEEVTFFSEIIIAGNPTIIQKFVEVVK